jgi:hypothetical protein
MSFELVSKYWAQPLSNVVLVLLAILILYPVIWKLSVRQISTAFEALRTAKDLPAHVTHLTEAADRIQVMNREFADLREKLGDLDAISEKLEIANRRIADLQKLTEQRPIDAAQDPTPDSPAHLSEIENWEAVSQIWFDVKDYVESKIDDLWDGRRRRKYSSIPRYTYDDITALMVSDGLISEEEAKIVNQMDGAFRSLRNRKTPVTPERVQAFRSWHDKVVAQAA